MFKKYFGIVVYSKIIKDNDLFVRILTSDDKLVSGIVYGGNSSKKKIHYQIGYFINLNLNLKNNNSPPSINGEITEPFIGTFINNKYKAFSLLSIVSLLNLSIIEGQKVHGLFLSINHLIITIKDELHWIVQYCQWLIYLLQIIGYEIEYKKKIEYKYFNLDTHEFLNNTKNQQCVVFPHNILINNKLKNISEVKSVFTIFENVFTKSHLNNIDFIMPNNYINFKNLILKELDK